MTSFAHIPGAVPGGDAVDGVVPAWTVRAGTVEDVQAVVRERPALVASGLGAHLDVGAPPRRLDVLLRLDGLNDVVDHQAADMTVTVQAGCALDALAQVLDAAGQWLPLDPPWPERTTVGGLVAANLSGPLRASQGTVRDLLLGIRVVGDDGALIAGGGRVVKNVAGYDLPKLYVGALGTLGVIVEATFKVRPRPAVEEAVVVACRSVRDAADVALAVRDALDPLWLEVAGRGGLAEGPGDGAAVAVGIAGLAEEVAHARAQVTAAARGARTIAVAGGAALRARLAAFAVEPAAAILRAATVPTEVGATMERLEATGRGVRCLAHFANGVVRAVVPDADGAVAAVRALRAALEAAGGSLVVERAIPAVKAAVDPWGDPGAAAALQRGIKAALDPDAIFAPGRHVGGL